MKIFFSINLKKAMAVMLGFTLLAVCFYASSDSDAVSGMADSEGVAMPILMYHLILKDEAASGKYTVTPSTLEADLKYLKDNGYTAVFPSELIDYTEGRGSLPDKPVMITFDDGYLNNLTYAVGLLEKYSMKAVISVVGSYSENFSNTPDPNPRYAHLSWDEIKKAADSGVIEIGNHTYDMHHLTPRKGCGKKSGESEGDYITKLKEDIGKAQKLLTDNCGITPTVFAYPYGNICDNSLEAVKELGFKVSFGCCENINLITKNPDSLYCLCRFNRPSGISTAEFMKQSGI